MKTTATLGEDRTQKINGVRGLLATQEVKWGGSLESLTVEKLERMILWDGSPLSHGLRGRIASELEEIRFLQQQLEPLEAEHEEKLEQEGKKMEMIRAGVGRGRRRPETPWRLLSAGKAKLF